MKIPPHLPALLLALTAACGAPSAPGSSTPGQLGEGPLLPTGKSLQPVGRSHPVGALPLTIVAPGAYALILSGYSEQGVHTSTPTAPYGRR